MIVVLGVLRCPDCGAKTIILSDYSYCDVCDVLRDGKDIVFRSYLWKSKAAKYRFVYSILLAKKGLIELPELLKRIETPMDEEDDLLPITLLKILNKIRKDEIDHNEILG